MGEETEAQKSPAQTVAECLLSLYPHYQDSVCDKNLRNQFVRGGRTKCSDLRHQREYVTEQELRGTDRSTNGHLKALKDHEAGFAREGRR